MADAHVYVVHCPERLDGIYVFSCWRDAERFRDAVIVHGGDAVLSEEPVNTATGAAELIAAEVTE